MLGFEEERTTQQCRSGIGRARSLQILLAVVISLLECARGSNYGKIGLSKGMKVRAERHEHGTSMGGEYPSASARDSARTILLVVIHYRRTVGHQANLCFIAEGTICSMACQRERMLEEMRADEKTWSTTCAGS